MVTEMLRCISQGFCWQRPLQKAGGQLHSAAWESTWGRVRGGDNSHCERFLGSLRWAICSPLPAPQGPRSGEALPSPWTTFEHHSSCCVQEHLLLTKSQPCLSGYQLQRTKCRATTPAAGQGDFQETRSRVFQETRVFQVFFSW